MNMDLEQRLADFRDISVPHSTVASLLRDYQRPNDKISESLAQQKLIPIKCGLYVVSPALTGGLVSLPLVANALYGPSYVSLEFALSHHGSTAEPKCSAQRSLSVCKLTSRSTAAR